MIWMPFGKRKFLERKNQVLYENYHLLNELYQKNERLYHDMNHHLQMISHLAERLNAIEIKEYVASISAPINELTDIVWSGVDIVDAILNHAVTEAGKYGIKMNVNVEFPKNSQIASDDLCVILFNLLDNALEACIKCRNHADENGTALKLFIDVTIRRIHQFLIIKVRNPYYQKPQRKFLGLFATTKTDTIHHGIGLHNVKEAVEKYNGNLEFESKDGLFITTALIVSAS